MYARQVCRLFDPKDGSAFSLSQSSKSLRAAVASSIPFRYAWMVISKEFSGGPLFIPSGKVLVGFGWIFLDFAPLCLFR